MYATHKGPVKRICLSLDAKTRMFERCAAEEKPLSSASDDIKLLKTIVQASCGCDCMYYLVILCVRLAFSCLSGPLSSRTCQPQSAVLEKPTSAVAAAADPGRSSHDNDATPQ